MASKNGAKEKSTLAHQKVWCADKKEQIKILVVDDNEDFRELLTESLQDEGYHVDSAKDAHEAIKKVHANPFTIIFLDIILPNMNGVATHKAIKKISPECIVIMMTGYSVKALVDEAVQDGAYTCMYKPFGLDDVLKLIDEILTKRHEKGRKEN